jgi:hypothetical protein
MLKFLHKKPLIQCFLKLFHTVINPTYVQSYKVIAHPRPDETPCIKCKAQEGRNGIGRALIIIQPSSTWLWSLAQICLIKNTFFKPRHHSGHAKHCQIHGIPGTLTNLTKISTWMCDCWVDSKKLVMGYSSASTLPETTSTGAFHDQTVCGWILLRAPLRPRPSGRLHPKQPLSWLGSLPTRKL